MNNTCNDSPVRIGYAVFHIIPALPSDWSCVMSRGAGLRQHDVAVGRNVLYLDHLIDFLSIQLLCVLAKRSDAAYWINMGAMAISTLAGALLVENASDAPFLASLLPFHKGFTVFYWATATWWIPMLLVLGVWRHVVQKFRLRYDPLYWGAVFPLGMFSIATRQM